MTLDPDSLEVASFAISSSEDIGTVGNCCTGCVSGCGINPTAGGCQSQGQTYEFVTCGQDTTIVAA